MKNLRTCQNMSSNVSNRKKVCKVENGKLAPLKFNGYCNELNTYDNIKLLNQQKKSIVGVLFARWYVGNGNYLFFEILHCGAVL